MSWDNNQADQVAWEVAMQEPILVMGPQETLAGEWVWTKGWPHLKYMEEERTHIASQPTNYYQAKEDNCAHRKRELYSPEGKQKTY